MVSKNMTGIPLITEVKQDNKTISKVETAYPVSLPTPQTGALMVPLSEKSFELQTITGTASQVLYDKYDTKGNLLQYTTKEGVPVAIVWGYNQTKPIAKIEGVTYDQIANLGILPAIVTASNEDATDPTKEGLLIIALNNFRKHAGLANFQVTTYTHNPSIGVTTITPSTGIMENYIYDNANRLEKIIDVNGNILKEFKYNYKN